MRANVQVGRTRHVRGRVGEDEDALELLGESGNVVNDTNEHVHHDVAYDIELPEVGG